jgi:flagellar basal body-associated protein FliL
MAEIHVERKRGVSPIIWVLLVLVLAALGWLAYSMYVVEQEPAQPAPAPTTTTSMMPGAQALAA